jgi:uncharacterized membrane protein
MIATLVAKVISLKKHIGHVGVKFGHCHNALYNDFSFLEIFNYLIFLNIDFQHFAFLSSYLSNFFMCVCVCVFFGELATCMVIKLNFPS